MPTDEQLRATMAAAMRGFAEATAHITDDQWELLSPCDGWTVFDVVDHVVAGERFVDALMSGASFAQAQANAVGLAPGAPGQRRDPADPTGAAQIRVAELRAAAADALTAFEAPLDLAVEHRVGPINARRLIGFRILDQLGHTWDLAEATGTGWHPDTEALAVGIEIARSDRPTLEASPNFACAAEDHIDESDPRLTFLHLIGRRPDPDLLDR